MHESGVICHPNFLFTAGRSRGCSSLPDRFQTSDSQRAGEGQEKIEGRDRDPDLEGEVGGAHQFEPLEGELRDGDHRDDGGVLDRRDELARQGRQDPPESLRQDHEAKLLPPGKPQGVGGLPLALLDPTGCLPVRSQ